MTVWQRLMLFPTLFLTALVASGGDWEIALGLSFVLGVLHFLKTARAVNWLDLFDRSTLAFGIAAGVPFGFNAARDADAGQTGLNAILHALWGQRVPLSWSYSSRAFGSARNSSANRFGRAI